MSPTPPSVEAGLDALRTAALLRELTAGMVATDDFTRALEHLVRTSQQAVPGAAWSSVTLLHAGSPGSVVSADPSAVDLDQAQYATGGPALTAIRRREVVRSGKLRGETRWPRWTPTACARGVRGVLCVPVDVDEHTIGSVNFYATRPGVLTDAQQMTAEVLAEHAGLLLAAVRDRERQAALAAEIDEALAYGDVISQAIGVVMSQRGCGPAQALEVLRAASETLAIPLPDVAERLVATVDRSVSR